MCLLALKRTVLVPDRQGALVRPAILVASVDVEPELIVATGHVVDKDGAGVLFSGAILPPQGVHRFSDDFVAAGVDVA